MRLALALATLTFIALLREGYRLFNLFALFRSLLAALHSSSNHGLERLLGKAEVKGMFSFAIYDLKNKKIFCARDHFGQKPFFYYYKENNFVFSSELTSLISNPLIVKELCRNSIFKYLHYDSFVGETTPIKNCFKLLPCHSLTFDLNTGNLIKKQYWKLDIKSKKIEKKDSYENFIDKLILRI